MRSSSGRIANVFLAKQIADELRLFLAPMQMTAHGGQEFGPVGGPALPEPVGLDVLVEQFVRVEFGAVARHPHEPQPLGMRGHNARGRVGPVYRMPIDRLWRSSFDDVRRAAVSNSRLL